MCINMAFCNGINNKGRCISRFTRVSHVLDCLRRTRSVIGNKERVKSVPLHTLVGLTRVMSDIIYILHRASIAN